MIDIEQIYNEYLTDKSNKNRQERYADNEKWYHASNAGRCYKIHWYSTRGTTQDVPSLKQNRIFEMGNIIHESFQKALIFKFGDKVFNEQEITIPRLNVRGFIDSVLPEFFLEQLGITATLIYDIKSMNSFSWKFKYGLVKNRKAQSGLAEIQLGTYALGLSESKSSNVLLPFNVVEPIIMNLVNYKKDDSQLKIELAQRKCMIQAEQYWEEAKLFMQQHTMKEPMPVTTVGCPRLSWECNYCSYAGTCNSPLYKKSTGDDN
uniref:Putative PD-(D/E)XK nuclease superfamily protein n=1 Tax=viral metagenome TaxID=1070528 RepID=A0A6H1ZU26_9ZZZZ